MRSSMRGLMRICGSRNLLAIPEASAVLYGNAGTVAVQKYVKHSTSAYAQRDKRGRYHVLNTYER